jgi:HSP20 family protein
MFAVGCTERFNRARQSDMTDQFSRPTTQRPARAVNVAHGSAHQFFSRFLGGRPLHATSPLPHAHWFDAGFPRPAVDIVEDERAFRIEAELPGVMEGDVELLVSGDTLILKGEKKEEAEETRGTTHLYERDYGIFQRQFFLPEGIDRGKISAKFDKGVLLITLPKSNSAAPPRTKIEIKFD